jgi:L-iditol 2-dehydrogenase
LKAVFIRGKRTVSIDETVAPDFGAGDILIRMKACGLCGSDLEKVYGEYGMSSGRLGHEPSGEIVAVGGSVAGLSVGDRVFVHHHVPCYSCYYCLRGDHTMCAKYHSSNIEPCGLSEEILVPEWNISRGGVIRLPKNMSFEKAALIEPLACCIRALNKCNIQIGDNVAIFGAGPAGIMHVLLSQSLGCGKIFLLDFNQFRLDLAREHCEIEFLNISKKQDVEKTVKSATNDIGVDISIIATGSPRAINQAIGLTRRGGKLLLFGVPSKGTQVTFDAGNLYSSELSLIPSYAASEHETNQAYALLNNSRINADWIITHRFTLEQAREAIVCAQEAKNSMKVIITT